MVKAFLFDYDGVISQGVDVTLPSKHLADSTGITTDRASELLKSIWEDYSTGVLTTDGMWEIIEKEIGRPVPAEKRNIWFTWEQLTPLPFMLEFVKELRAAGYPVGLISNVFHDTAQIIRQNGGYDGFDFLVLSYEVGTRKPQPRMYEIALEKLDGLEPEEVVYLDDRESLVQAARELGFQSIYVTDQAKAIAEVKQLLGW
ncbi:MAG TPA: HAD family phosphatase [Candidatus Saccharimonadales bacterium]